MGGARLCLGMGAGSLWNTSGRRRGQPSTDRGPVGVGGGVGGEPRPSGPGRAGGAEPRAEQVLDAVLGV